MATVAEQFWREVLDLRRPLEPVERRRPRPAFLPTPRSIRSWGIGTFGIALAVALWVATTQNAIPWGELHCVS